MPGLAPVRHHAFTVTVPAGTTASAPVTQALIFPPGRLDRVDVLVPEGHAGTTGVALDYAGQQVAPFDAGTWIVADGETVPLVLDFDVVGAQLQARGFNTDVYDHAFYLRLTVEEFVTPAERAGQAPGAPITEPALPEDDILAGLEG